MATSSSSSPPLLPSPRVSSLLPSILKSGERISPLPSTLSLPLAATPSESRSDVSPLVVSSSTPLAPLLSDSSLFPPFTASKASNPPIVSLLPNPLMLDSSKSVTPAIGASVSLNNSIIQAPLSSSSWNDIAKSSNDTVIDYGLQSLHLFLLI